MDDLAGLDWNASSSKPAAKPAQPAMGSGNYFPTLKPTPPTSGRSTPSLTPQPASGGGSASKPPAKSGTPSNDSFANLLSGFGGAGGGGAGGAGRGTPPKNLSLADQQRLLEKQREEKADAQRRAWDKQFGGGSGGGGLDSLGGGAGQTNGRFSAQNSGSSPLRAGTPQSSVAAGAKKASGGDDILAAFNKDAPVDRSTNFPVPGRDASRSSSAAPARQGTPLAQDGGFDDDDDPFDLGKVSAGKSKPARAATKSTNDGDDDDDVLGLLGKPVSDLPPRKTAASPAADESPSPPRAKRSSDPADKALAELVDMGFPPDKARAALRSTESGVDVQAAVGYLLNQAHAQSKSKTRGAEGEDDRSRSRPREDSGSRGRQQHGSGLPEEKDPAKVAQEIGSNFFKTANSLWKSGAKRLNKAVAEFNAADGADPNQPKWMRSGGGQYDDERDAPRPAERQSKAPERKKPQADLIGMTDEAMLLEGGGGRPQPGRKQQSRDGSGPDLPRRPAPDSRTSSNSSLPPKHRFNKQALEDETAQAYVSPARRRKAAPAAKAPEEPDLLFGNNASTAAAPAKSRPATRPQPSSQPRPKRPSTPPRPKAPPRNIPSVSSIALQSSGAARTKGNEAFKLGNYGDAAAAYSRALQGIPDQHPLRILILTNRALANLKTGDPKACIADSEAALAIIGVSRGADETIDEGTGAAPKDMAPFYAKAATRRAEALEQLERWADAAQAWRDCVEAGVGGGLAIQARNRCELAARPKPAAAPKPKPKPAPARRPPPKKTSAVDQLGGSGGDSGESAEAVQRLRAAHAAAARADDEKFALAGSVDARLTAWRKGKEGNLRALLGSLDAVLWAGSGWRKVGMSELIVPGKVKVAYMKGIAKVHPDKLPTTATTEQIMISGAVFSTLNEAWDKFKAENGM